jgi:hypothetical protein
MSKKQQDWQLTSIRLPKTLIKKLHFYQEEYKARTGLEISLSSLHRTFLEEGLKNRGITDNVFTASNSSESSKQE